MKEEQKKAIKKHFDKQIKDFKKEMIHLAIEHEHPYIMATLEKALEKTKEDIRDGKCDCRYLEIGLTGYKWIRND